MKKSIIIISFIVGLLVGALVFFGFAELLDRHNDANPVSDLDIVQTPEPTDEPTDDEQQDDDMRDTPEDFDVLPHWPRGLMGLDDVSDVTFTLIDTDGVGARLRDGPGIAGFNVIEILAYDAELIYLDEYVKDDDIDGHYWLHVQSQSGMKGFISSQLITPMAQDIDEASNEPVDETE